MVVSMNREDIIRIAQDEIIEMANQAGIVNPQMVINTLEAFAKLVAEHERNTMNDEAKAHLEELRKNFNAESAELRLHMWSQEKQA
jgi:vancomycin resistance protein YoaR